MERTALITVEKTFCRHGEQHPERSVLIIEPRLPVPTGGWTERTETVVIVRPDGREQEATATISLSHLNIQDPDVPADERWRVTVLFHGLTSDEVPDGSRILVLNDTRNALLPKNVA